MRIYVINAKLSGVGIVNFTQGLGGIIEFKFKCKSEANAIKALKRTCKLTSCKLEEIITIEVE